MDYLTFLLWFTFLWRFLCVTKQRKSIIAKLPPGPIALPIIGSLFKVGNNIVSHESLTKLANIYGPIMSLKLGGSITIVVSSSNIAKQILQKYDQVFASRTVPDALRASKHNESSIMWLPSSSQHWRTVRRISNSHMLSSTRLEAHQDLRYQKMKDLIAYVHKSSQTGRSVDIGEAAFTTVLNLLSNIIFSMDLAKINSKAAFEFKAIVRAVLEEVGRPNLADVFPILRPLDPQGVRDRMESLFGRLDKFFDQMIDQKLQSRISEDTPSKNDLLDALLDDGKENDPKLTRVEIKALLKDILIQGTDTSSSTWEWAMAELLRNPDKMEKMQSELRENVVNEHIHESDFEKLPYLQAMWKETLRMHPPIPLLVHKAETETEICGYTVPKHAKVLVNVWAIGRDPNVWENPNSFTPERFLGSNNVVDFRGRDFELIPFGAGRRICPGLSLAEKVAHLNLAGLLKSFDWKLEGEMKPKDMNMEETTGFAITKDQPLLAIPKVW